ncbi:MAG: DNA mismatch repair protein MutS [Nitrospinae bacterium]|nr:DNA mismatch repair protein MutS [Nitrospinota bacterium]
MSQLTPLMRQYMAIKKNYPDCVLFFRMGDFYEMFFEDAVAASRILNIALTSRDKGADGKEKTPMCGVPYHALEAYLGKMVKHGQKVAICEQMEDPALAKGIVKREVVRVVTPGTLTEDWLLDEKSSNFLAAVAPGEKGIGFAAADLSTGNFTAREFEGPRAVDALMDELARLMPKEVLVPHDAGGGLLEMLGDYRVEKLDFLAFDTDESTRRLQEQFDVSTLEGFGLHGRGLAVSAAGGIVHYVKKNAAEVLASLHTIRWVKSGGEMELDAATLRNLEILQNIGEGSVDGTLVAVLDKTRTAMGGRLLREWMVKPLKDRETILQRQAAVTAFFSDPSTAENFRARLANVDDFERAITRIAGKSFNPRDFSSLQRSLAALPALREEAAKLPGYAIAAILAEWDDVAELADLLDRAVSPSHPATFKDVGFMREGFSKELDELRGFRDNATESIRKLEEKERAATGISTLKVGYNKIYGYYIEITHRNIDKAPANYIRKQSLVNCERFVSPELKEIEEKLLSSDERAKQLEAKLVEELRAAAAGYIKRVRGAAGVIARLDVASALAEGARLYGYCAPEMLDTDELALEESRHPVIERLMTEENFVPNNIAMEGERERLMVITGPNMAGKSTYLRQVALAVLMAQMGGYVAAKSARIGIADRIFTRVGAQDRLQKGLSTFMVEMVETANILNNATGRSVVILDEIGRGTSTFDGISIAWAVAEFLARLKARTIFATHYHELTDLAFTEPGVANYNVTVKEQRERLVFLRKVEPGPADKSYGIQVARLAGLPKEVLKRAKAVLKQLEKMELDADGRPALKGADMGEGLQVPLFTAPIHPVVEGLRETDIDNMTPLDALNYLHHLKEKLE